MNKVILGDCLEVMKTLPDNSVDSIVTDPPYHLVSIVKRFGGENARNTPAMNTKEGGVFARKAKGFMGKEWDGLGEDGIGIANNPLMWAECLRVLKPGGHLLAFSGTRTYHRMASAIEDAGFEVRDMIEWIYSTGFPKSLNIGKAVDKLQGNEREVKGLVDSKTSNNKDNNTFNASPRFYESTKGTSEWEGWGTALKPAHEPICMARKPLAEKTVAENVLKYGTGGINIDESRVGEEERTFLSRGIRSGANHFVGDTEKTDNGEVTVQGRFPANLIHDNSEEVRECFPETKGAKETTSRVMENPPESWKQSSEVRNINSFADSGNASRFFKSIEQVVDLNDFSIYNRSILTNIKQLCGQHLTKKKTGIMLGGVILEAEKFIQDAELLMSGNSTMEKFLTDTVSTTKTLIAQMTELKTLNVLPNWLITKFTEESEKTIKSLKELNTEDVKSAKSIFLLQTFISEVLESIRAIAEIVAEKDSNNGDYKSLLYQAKASKSERNKGCEEMEDKERIDYGGFHSEKGLIENNRNPENRLPNKNNHPTVKPIALMEYLIKMVTPKGGIVLDPFAGSGSTLVAAKQNGFNYVGIEMTEEYIPIIEARLSIEKPNTLF